MNEASSVSTKMPLTTLELSDVTSEAIAGFTSAIGSIADPVLKGHLSTLLGFMVSTQAPASTTRTKHGAFDLGLVTHSWMLYQVARSVAANSLIPLTLEMGQRYPEPAIKSIGEMVSGMSHVNHRSILVVSLLHDFNKAATLAGSPYYEPKLLTSGKRSDAAPWKISDTAKGPMSSIASSVIPTDQAWASIFAQFEEGIVLREGMISLAAAEKVSPGVLSCLTDEEKKAIVYHDGAYAGRTGLQGQESILQQVCHFADMIASRWIS